MAYCSPDDVKHLLTEAIAKRIDESADETVMFKRLETLDITNFISNAEDIIDGAISVLYITPLVQIVEVKRSDMSETFKYPEPISYMTALLAAYLVYQKNFSEENPPNSAPKIAEEFKNQAMKFLNDIRSGAIDLKGQRKVGWRYVRPETKNVNRLPVEFKEFDYNK